MAQSEDTELRDLVMEALEKNGSLAKIRALLRANIFLAFEDDYESIRQNVTLDSVLKVPEGILALSIVHEFLEFCNLKNTLFVYKSETRQEREYKYEGQKKLSEKLNIKQDGTREPVLVSIVKLIFKSHQRHYSGKTNHGALKNDNSNYKDDQNCTYIVHDDSTSTTSQSHSDNSSDEKTKLHLRLQLDNSDTDTSSDSARDKSSSEYIPNAHILQVNEDHSTKHNATVSISYKNEKNLMLLSSKANATPPYLLNELKIVQNSSSDSTSYAELKPFNASEEKLLNTTGIPISSEDNYNSNNSKQSPSKENIKIKHTKNGNEPKNNSSLNSLSYSNNKENGNNKDKETEKKSQELSAKSDSATAEYSYDFSFSGGSKNKGIDSENLSPHLVQEELPNDNVNKTTLDDSPRGSHSSKSSISISDVADLISEKSVSIVPINNDNDVSINKSKLSSHHLSKSPRSIKSPSNDSGDFSESPVPSLSNLSLDINSD